MSFFRMFWIIFLLLEFIKMGDLATEIEQMQQDINAFDDELDALEQ